MRIKMAVLLLVGVFVLASGSLMAQQAFGLRAGVTIEPEQFHFGAHFITNPLIKALTFRPNLEMGVGSSVTTFALNFEFAYSIPIPKTDYSAYIGLGPALNVFDHDNGNDDFDTGGGLNVLLGVEHQDGLFGEIKIGAFDSPDFKFTIGYTFK